MVGEIGHCRLAQPTGQQCTAQPLQTQLVGPDIYRAKGLVLLSEDPDRRYVYQQVGHRWTLEPGSAWGAVPWGTRLVVIGKDGAAPPDAWDVLVGVESVRHVPAGRA